MTLLSLVQVTSRYVPPDGTDNPMAYFTLVLGFVLGFVLWWVTHDCDKPDDGYGRNGGGPPPDPPPVVPPDLGPGGLVRPREHDIDDELKRLIEQTAKKDKAGVG